MKTSSENDLTWLVGQYVGFVWSKIYVAGDNVSLETFIGFLKFKYREFTMSSGMELRQLGVLEQ